MKKVLGFILLSIALTATMVEGGEDNASCSKIFTLCTSRVFETCGTYIGPCKDACEDIYESCKRKIGSLCVMDDIGDYNKVWDESCFEGVGVSKSECGLQFSSLLDTFWASDHRLCRETVGVWTP